MNPVFYKKNIWKEFEVFTKPRALISVKLTGSALLGAQGQYVIASVLAN